MTRTADLGSEDAAVRSLLVQGGPWTATETPMTPRPHPKLGVLFSPVTAHRARPGVLYVRSEGKGQPITVPPQLVCLLPHEPGERWC
ncbi:MAG: hypothetical protein ACRDRQ_24790 [Pseudonocardiaceae bacterium]